MITKTGSGDYIEAAIDDALEWEHPIVVCFSWEEIDHMKSVFSSVIAQKTKDAEARKDYSGFNSAGVLIAALVRLDAASREYAKYADKNLLKGWSKV